MFIPLTLGLQLLLAFLAAFATVLLGLSEHVTRPIAIAGGVVSLLIGGALMLSAIALVAAPQCATRDQEL